MARGASVGLRNTESSFPVPQCPQHLQLRSTVRLFLSYVIGFLALLGCLSGTGSNGILDLEASWHLKNSRQIRIWIVSRRAEGVSHHCPHRHWLALVCIVLASRKLSIMSGWSPSDCFANPFSLAFYFLHKEKWIETICSLIEPLNWILKLKLIFSLEESTKENNDICPWSKVKKSHSREKSGWEEPLDGLQWWGFSPW